MTIGAHPRETTLCRGHGTAESLLARWVEDATLPHSLLITGPEGVGKATLAYRLAAYLLSEQGGGRGEEAGLFGDLPAAPRDLSTPAADAAAGRVRAGTHGDLLVIEPAYDDKKGLRKENILLDDVQSLHGFLGHTASEGGWRVAIVDTADAMNLNAANALLKLLEEPPTRSLLILLSHNPGKLLPTIRSRCRVLALAPLDSAGFAAVVRQRLPELVDADLRLLYELSEGAPGSALRLHDASVLTYHPLVQRLSAGSETEPLLAKDPQEQKLVLWLLRRRLAQLAREEALAPHAAARRPGYWLQQWERAEGLCRDAQGLYLDAKQVTAALLRAITGQVPLSEQPA